MSEEGTTWFKNSGRKLAAVVAGAAMLAGAAGVAVADSPIVDASATRSVVVESNDSELVVKASPAVDEADSDKEAVRKLRRPFKGTFASAKSTWS